MHAMIAKKSSYNVTFDMPNFEKSGIRELHGHELDYVSGVGYFTDALDFAQATFNAAPPEAQFLFLVSTGAVLGFATAGPPGALVGAAGGVSTFITLSQVKEK